MHYRTILLAALLAGCSAPAAPEDAVRAWLERAEAAVEARDRDTLLELVSERYVDQEGNDKDGVGQRLRLYFLRHRNILIASDVEKLIVSGGTAAEVVLTAGMVGRDASALGFGAERLRFELELELEQEDGAWRLVDARWTEP